MSDLVKTKFEILAEIGETIISGYRDEYEKLIFDKLLVLPSGLDVLEDILKKELRSLNNDRFSDDRDVIVSSVFARFKQDIGLVNTEGKKNENGI